MDLMAEYALVREQLKTLQQLTHSGTADEAWDHLEHLRHALRFDYCGIGIIKRQGDERHVAVDYASAHFEQVVADFVELGLDRVDPAAKALANGMQQVYLPEAMKKAPKAERGHVREVGEFLAARGFGAHMAMRINMQPGAGIGFLAFGNIGMPPDHEFLQRAAALGPSLHLGALAFTEAACRQARDDHAKVLTRNEIKVLSALAAGLSPVEIAEAESKSLSTVRKQLESACRRLGARSVRRQNIWHY